MQYVFDRDVVFEAVVGFKECNIDDYKKYIIKKIESITIGIEENNLYKYTYQSFRESINNNGLGSFLFITYNKWFVLPERTNDLIDDCFMIISGLLEEDNKDIKEMFDEFCDKYLHQFRYSKADSWKEFISYGVTGIIAMESDKQAERKRIIERLKSTTATQIILTDDEVRLLNL